MLPALPCCLSPFCTPSLFSPRPPLPPCSYTQHRDLFMALSYLACGCWRVCSAGAGGAAACGWPGGSAPSLGPLKLGVLALAARLCSLAARTQVRRGPGAVMQHSMRACACPTCSFSPLVLQLSRGSINGGQTTPGPTVACTPPHAGPAVCASTPAGAAVCLQCSRAAGQLPRQRRRRAAGDASRLSCTLWPPCIATAWPIANRC